MAEEQPVVGTSTNDVSKEDVLKQAMNLLVQGKRHLLVKDVGSALTSLGESCQLLSEANGALCPDNAEAHFYYGKALLEQARLELNVFEGGQGAGDKEESEDDSEDEEEEEEAKDEAAVESEIKDGEEGGKTGDDMDVEDEAKKEEDLSIPSPQTKPASIISEPMAGQACQDGEQPGPSSAMKENGKEEKEGEEELSNLELAWEVLEIAKIGYGLQLKTIQEKLEKVDKENEEEKAGMNKSVLHLKNRLAETHCILGEVATESESYAPAVEDFKTGIKILTEVEGDDSREVAQYYFQMGIAYAFDKKFQLAIDSFKTSKAIIELRISNVQAKIDNKQTLKDLGMPYDDEKYTEAEEVAELRTLLPELDEKVADTIDAERESLAAVEEEKQEQEVILKNSPVKNPNPPAANDISHLVKKKKRTQDDVSNDTPPAKKVCTEDVNANGNGGPLSQHGEASNGHVNGSNSKPMDMEQS